MIRTLNLCDLKDIRTRLDEFDGVKGFRPCICHLNLCDTWKHRPIVRVAVLRCLQLECKGLLIIYRSFRAVRFEGFQNGKCLVRRLNLILVYKCRRAIYILNVCIQGTVLFVADLNRHGKHRIIQDDSRTGSSRLHDHIRMGSYILQAVRNRRKSNVFCFVVLSSRYASSRYFPIRGRILGIIRLCALNLSHGEGKGLTLLHVTPCQRLGSFRGPLACCFVAVRKHRSLL